MSDGMIDRNFISLKEIEGRRNLYRHMLNAINAYIGYFRKSNMTSAEKGFLFPKNIDFVKPILRTLINIGLTEDRDIFEAIKTLGGEPESGVLTFTNHKTGQIINVFSQWESSIDNSGMH